MKQDLIDGRPDRMVIARLRVPRPEREVRVFRIVLVEDNPTDVVFVREALKHHGVAFSLEHYGSGDDALKALSAMQEQPSLILLDISLPHVSGFELLKTIRNHEVLANVPVAIITSSAAAVDKTTGQRLGIDAYLVKPCNYEEFMRDVGGEIARILHKGAAVHGQQLESRGSRRDGTK